MKELTLKRRWKFPDSTIGVLKIPGIEREFFVCEDTVREPENECAGVDSAAWVATWKKKGITAIPTGRYKLAWTLSTRFKRNTLQLLDVPGYGGIRIHAGNKSADTEGCLLPGLAKAGGEVRNSRAALDMLEGFLLAGKAGKLDLREETWITITNEFTP